MSGKRRFLSLRSKVILIILLFHVILILFFVVPMVRSEHKILEEQLIDHYTEQLLVMAHFLGPVVKRGEIDSLESFLQTVSSQQFVQYAVAYDLEGNPLGGRDPASLSELAELPPAPKPHTPGAVFRERGPGPSGFSHVAGHDYDWVQPLFADSQFVGYLNLGVKSAAINRFAAESLRKGIWITVLAMAFGGAVAFWVDLQMRRTLVRLIGVTSRMARGDLSTRIDISTGDELELLGESFNRMADALKQREQELLRARENLEETVMERTAELRDSQRALVQHEKMAGIGQLAAGVAHEINTPIATIIASSQFLHEDIQNPECKQDIERIRSEALRCKQIVQNLLDFSRRPDQERYRLDLRELIRKAMALVRHDMEMQKIGLSEDCGARELPVQACENEIVQVFFNLFQNSKDSMPDGGQVKVQVRGRDRDRVRVLVADSGSGIPAEVQSKIFDPFFTTKEVGLGTGLGLAICYRIIEEHEGSIFLKKSDGEGTVFEIELPLKGNKRHV